MGRFEFQRLNVKTLQRSTQGQQFIGTQPTPTALCRHTQRQMPIRCAARAHTCAARFTGSVPMNGTPGCTWAGSSAAHAGHRLVALAHPVQGAGVAADEPGGH